MYQEQAPARPPAGPEPGPLRYRSGPGRATVGHGRGGAILRAVEADVALEPRPRRAVPTGLTIEIHADGGRTRLGAADLGAETLASIVALLEAEFGAGYFGGRRRQDASPEASERTAGASRGRRPRGCPARGWDALTPAELEVVALVAEGLSNAEIGRRLFIAPATAKSHLHHVFGKVGVANRTQLAAAAIERRSTR